MKKKESTLEHVQKRALERYGMNLNEATLTTIKRKIRKGLKNDKMKKNPAGEEDAILVERQRRITGGRSIWRVPVDGKIFKVVYENPTKRIVTVLPMQEKL